MSAGLIALLTALEAVIGEFASPSAGVITQVINGLLAIIPALSAAVPEAVASVQAIIASLQNGGNITATQLTQLQTMSAQVDANAQAAASADGLSP